MACNLSTPAEHAAAPDLTGEARAEGIAYIILPDIAMQPVREVKKAVVHRDQEVRDQARNRHRPPFGLYPSNVDDLLHAPASILFVPVEHVGAQGSAHEPVGAVRVVMPANLQRYPAFLPEIDALGDLALLPVPEVELPTVLTLGHIAWVKPSIVGVRSGPLAADHGVVARLVPEVVVKVHAVHAVLPAPGDVEVLVDQQEAPRSVALAVADHGDHHVSIC